MPDIQMREVSQILLFGWSKFYVHLILPLTTDKWMLIKLSNYKINVLLWDVVKYNVGVLVLTLYVIIF